MNSVVHLAGGSSRSWTAVAVAALMLAAPILLPVLAPAHAGSGEARQYKLAAGDRITVVVMGQPDLSGSFTIENGGDIRLPLVGSLNVSGITVADSQERIRLAFSRGFIKQPSVSVRIDEVRPVHVLGAVRSPGSYKYQYGSVAKTAIAQAGGFGALVQSVTSVPDFILADERAQTLGARHDMLAVKRARLEAQLAGAREFEPPRPKSLAKSEVDRIVAAELRTLHLRLDAHKAQLELFKLQKADLQAADTAIAAQVTSEQQQVKLLREQVASYAQLKTKGLARSSVEMTLNLSLAAKISDIWKLEGERARLRVAISDLESRINQADNTTRVEALNELATVEQQLFEVESALPAARQVRAWRAQEGGAADADQASFRIIVTRTRDGQAAVMQAKETTPIEPGDIIEVKAEIPVGRAEMLGTGRVSIAR